MPEHLRFDLYGERAVRTPELYVAPNQPLTYQQKVDASRLGKWTVPYLLVSSVYMLVMASVATQYDETDCAEVHACLAVSAIGVALCVCFLAWRRKGESTAGILLDLAIVLCCFAGFLLSLNLAIALEGSEMPCSAELPCSDTMQGFLIAGIVLWLLPNAIGACFLAIAAVGCIVLSAVPTKSQDR